MTHVILLAAVGFIGGAFGSMIGLGGGVFIVPALVLFLDVPVHQAVAASLMAVVATSTTASIAYLRDDLTNQRLGVTLVTASVSGALVGGFVGALLSKEVLSAIFGVVTLAASLYMLLRSRTVGVGSEAVNDPGPLGASYYDRAFDKTVTYRPRRLSAGMGAGLVGGVVSGLLGVGGGFLMVPVMVLAMAVPMRAAAATSNFMIGATACAGATVYLAQGLVDPVTTVTVVLGVTVGAFLGSRLAQRVKSSVLTVMLTVVLLALAVQMLLAAAGVSVR